MYIDFHTHIIPRFDDGAKDVDMSLAMLRTARKSGAKKVILTPHYSTRADIGEFFCLREKRVNELKAAMQENPDDYPEILVGAEAALDGSLTDVDDISPLLIEGTDLLLLELPYTSWSSWYNNGIYDIIVKHNVTPIMAHIERYLDSPKDVEKLSTLASFGVKFQVNAPSFLSHSGKKIIKTLAEKGLISAIGSDCHNLDTRSPDIEKAMAQIDKKLGRGFCDFVYERTQELLNK